MAFKERLTRMFRRTGAADPSPAPIGNAAAASTDDGDEADPFADLPSDATERALVTPSPAQTEQREREHQLLLQHLGDGFQALAGTLDQLDQHLEQSGTTLASIAKQGDQLESIATSQRDLIERQVALADGNRQLVERTVAATEANRELVGAVAEHLKQREQEQAQLVAHLAEMDSAMRLQREHEQRQLDRLLTIQRSGRRLVAVGMLCGFAIIVVLLVLVLVLALQPQLLRGDGTPAAATQAPATTGSTEPEPATRPVEPVATAAAAAPSRPAVAAAGAANNRPSNDDSSSLDPSLARLLALAATSTEPAIADMAAHHLGDAAAD